MTVNTGRRAVVFKKPFLLDGFDEVLAVGAYVVEFDEVPMDGVSFIANRPVSTRINKSERPERQGGSGVLTIDPNELNAALMRDHEPEPVFHEGQ
jgi:hypothetical protein